MTDNTGTPAKPENPYAQTYANFLKNTENHVLNVIHDDGLYRHLRFQEPGTRMWSMDIVTWPGHLATSGDIGEGLMFSREEDMIPFFYDAGRGPDGYYSDGAPSIDFHYWAEKIQGRGLVDVRKYDPDLFLQLVREHLEESEALGDDAQDEYQRQMTLLQKLYALKGKTDADLQLAIANYRAEQSTAAFGRSSTLFGSRIGHPEDPRRATANLWSTDGLSDEQQNELAAYPDWLELGDTDIPETSPAERRAEILEDAKWHSDSDHDAHEWLRDNEEHVGADTWEWDLRGFDTHFLFACYCIDAAVRLYREHQEKLTAASALRTLSPQDQNDVLGGMLTDVRLYPEDREALLAWFEEKNGRITVEGSTLSREQLDALITFAECGYTRELGAIDPRMNYTDAEQAEMKARFENVRAGLDALRAQRESSRS